MYSNLCVPELYTVHTKCKIVLLWGIKLLCKWILGYLNHRIMVVKGDLEWRVKTKNLSNLLPVQCIYIYIENFEDLKLRSINSPFFFKDFKNGTNFSLRWLNEESKKIHKIENQVQPNTPGYQFKHCFRSLFWKLRTGWERESFSGWDHQGRDHWTNQGWGWCQVLVQGFLWVPEEPFYALVEKSELCGS